MILITAHPVRSHILMTPRTRIQYVVDLTPQQVSRKSVRIGRNVMVVADVSGSMSGQGLDNLKPALTKLVNSLEDGVVVGLIVFSASYRVLYQPTALDSSTRRDLLSKIKSLQAEDTTRFAEPLQKAFSLFTDHDVNLVVLTTDGDSTVNPMDDYAQVKALLSSHQEPIIIFASGSSYRQDVVLDWVGDSLSEMSFTSHITSQGQDLKQELDNIANLLNKVVGYNGTLRISPNNHIKLLPCYFMGVTFLNDLVPGNNVMYPNDVVVPLSVLSAGQQMQLVVEAELTAVVQTGSYKVATIYLDYYDSAGVATQETFDLLIEFVDDLSKQSSPNQSMLNTYRGTLAQSAIMNATAGGTIDPAKLTKAQTLVGTLPTTDPTGQALSQILSGLQGPDDGDSFRKSMTRVRRSPLSDLLDGMGDS